MSTPSRKPATYDDLLKLPDHVVGEIVDGELHAAPRPRAGHALLAFNLIRGPVGTFGSGGGDGPGGWWIVPEPELHIDELIVVPDLAGWRRDRLPVFPSTAPFIELVPDWACEILSPGTARFDRVRKVPAFARAGVGHLWLIDPELRTLEVLRRESGHWVLAGQYSEGDRARIEPFEQVEVDLSLWWPPSGS